MKENKYDDQQFFEQYGAMSRSVLGLRGAGEWHALRSIMPDMRGKTMLDLGCGYGWHCKYAIEQGASQVVGIDLSQKMINKAIEINSDPKIRYSVMAVEDFPYGTQKFDVILSSLTLHYIESFDDVCKNVRSSLNDNGVFIFSAEHPIFTAYGTQEWYRDSDGKIIHWAVDNYFKSGARHANFLGEDVVKYHRTVTDYIGGLLGNGFAITSFIEPQPTQQMIDNIEGMSDELRRPMMMIISATKK